MTASLRSSSDAPPVDQEQLRAARLEAASANAYWQEIEFTLLVRRGPFLVRADNDSLWTLHRGTIWNPSSADVVFNDRLSMWFTVDSAGDVVFLEKSNAPATWSEVVERQGSLYVLLTAKLLVNHDRERQVGSVLELTEFPDVDGNWLAARCRVDSPPSWLQAGKTSASFSHPTTLSRQIGNWTHVLKGVLTEVSLLAPNVRPMESRARVLVLREVPDANRSLPAAVPKTSDRAAVGEVELPARKSCVSAAVRCSEFDDAAPAAESRLHSTQPAARLAAWGEEASRQVERQATVGGKEG